MHLIGPAIILLFLSSATISAQNSVAAILDEHHAATYIEICEKIEEYFKIKHPGLKPADLCIGKHRDGEYVKYKRWQHFWKSRLDTSGHMADLAYYHQKAHKNKILTRKNEVLDQLEWNNISYNENLGVQIGLGRTNAVAFHPSDHMTFYVAAAIGGLWKTEDGGQNYIPLGDDLPFLAVSSVIVDQKNPETIYIAVSDRVWYGPPSIGVYKSSDGGISWSATALSFTFRDNTRIYWMEADPNNPEVMMVGTTQGLFRTDDGFETYDKITGGSICDVKFMPGSSDVVYYVTDNSTGFFKSSDGGKNFSFNYRVGEAYKRILVTPLDTNKVFVCTSGDEKLYESYDAGESLSSSRDISESEVRDGICVFSQLADTDIYAGWFNMFHSTDGGQNFDQISDWLGRQNLQLIHVDQRNAFCNPLQPELIYLCNDGGLYTVNVTTNEFNNLSNGLQITQFYDIGISQVDKNIVSGGSQDNGNVLLFDQDWFPTAPTADGMMQAHDSSNPDLIYNGIQNGIIYRYDNGVEDVISDNLPNNVGGNGEWVTPFQTDPNRPNVIVAAFDKVYLSPNKGDLWVEISDELADGRELDYLEIAPSDSERIYVVENYGKGTGDLYGQNHSSSDLFANTKGLTDWEKIDLPVDENVEDIVIDPKDADHLYIVCSGYLEGHKIFESTDAGLTWTNISGTLPNLPATAVAYYEGENDYLFVGTDGGVYYSSVDNIDWRSAGNFPNTYISEIEIQKDAKLIRVGTHGRGIFEGFLDLENVATINVEQKDCVQVYPNPVEAELFIYEKDANTLLEILNAEGQTLISSFKNKLDLSSLTPGNYYLKSSAKEMAPCLMKLVKI